MLGEHEQAGLRWTASAPRAELSFHQRLMAPVEIRLDGRDLETRRGAGELVFFVQITDRDGARYQTHGSGDLSKLDENIKTANLEYSQLAYFLPGDYRLAVAILDTTTGEHSTRQTQFRVAPRQRDLLPDAWLDLPPVEFIGKAESPGSWYRPTFTVGCGGPPPCIPRPESTSFSMWPHPYRRQDRVELKVAIWQLCFPPSK